MTWHSNKLLRLIYSEDVQEDSNIIPIADVNIHPLVEPTVELALARLSVRTGTVAPLTIKQEQMLPLAVL